MRLWSLHPKYLDSKGLGATWGEGLQGLHAIEGCGLIHKYHPQLQRFKKTGNAGNALRRYLLYIWQEANRRRYNYDIEKIVPLSALTFGMRVTRGQLYYEKELLQIKLATRKKPDKQKCEQLFDVLNPEPNPMFRVVDGDVEDWERVKVKR